MARREFNDLSLLKRDTCGGQPTFNLYCAQCEPILQCISDELVRDFCALGDFLPV